MGNYVDAMDLIFNNSIVNWIQDQFYTKTEVDDINTSMKNYADGTFVDVAGDNMTGVLNTTAGINLENNASISRSETDTKTWISESGNWITQFGT